LEIERQGRMGKKGLPQGIRKFVRREKARIRRESSSMDEEKRRIEDLLERLKEIRRRSG
jgi:hypothetical protein